MYRRPKFLEVLIEIRQQMALEADYDVDLFTEMARSGVKPHSPRREISRGQAKPVHSPEDVPELARSKDT